MAASRGSAPQPLVQRTVTPFGNSDLSTYYSNRNGGGINTCRRGNGTVFHHVTNTLPNCTGYAQGRALETWGEEYHSGIRVLNNDANGWVSRIRQYHSDWVHNSPAVGALVSTYDPSGKNSHGHVYFIEQLNSDGGMYISESGWSRTEALGWGGPQYQPGGFWYGYVKPGQFRFGYRLCGYILPPDITTFQTTILDVKRFEFTTNGNLSYRVNRTEWRTE